MRHARIPHEIVTCKVAQKRARIKLKGFEHPKVLFHIKFPSNVKKPVIFVGNRKICFSVTIFCHGDILTD